MGKPKEYVGETWSNPWDHGGKDYRWDHEKKEYVESFGTSPAAAISRSLKGLSSALSQDDEAESTLESVSKIVDAAVTIQKISDNRKKAGEPTETESGENVATLQMKDYFDADVQKEFKKHFDSDSSKFNVEKLKQLNYQDSKEKVVAKTFLTNKKTLDKSDEQTHYQKMRQTAGERHKKRMEDVLAKGSPLKQSELDKQRGVGTPVNDLFKKPADTTNAYKDNQLKIDEQKPEAVTKNLEKDKIIDEGKNITDSVKDIDGQIGDFVDPDKLKFKSLFGNFGVSA